MYVLNSTSLSACPALLFQFLQVNNNGAISFDAPESAFTPSPFPLSGDLQMIAVYWADVDTRNETITNAVWYRMSTDLTLLRRARQQIREAFVHQSRFIPTFLFIATWEEVGYFNLNANLVRES